ncbi:MAG: ADP-ribosylation factor-like protein [Candidatus Hodarchaeota archaeon]
MVGKIKVIFAGLDFAGKTSFLNSLEEKYSSLINIKPTLGADRREYKLATFKIQIWDLGGQKMYRDSYMGDKKLYFDDTDALFFLFDIQDKDRDDEALNYLKSILDIFKEGGQAPNLTVCWHKSDLDLHDLPEYKERISAMEARLEDITNGYRYKTFKTTIFEAFSLVKAFSEGVIGASPKKMLIDAQLKDFAKKTFSSACMLLDGSYLVLGSNTNSEQLLEIIEAVVAQTGTAFSKLDRYDIHATNMIISLKPGEYYKEIMGKEMLVLYVPMKVNDILFSLLSLTKNPNTLKLMMKHSTELAEKLSDILEHFYFE